MVQDHWARCIGRTLGAWTSPVCDQGFKFWTYDVTNKAGLDSRPVHLPTFHNACRFQGSGTAAFYKAIGIFDGDLYKVVGVCEVTSLNIDPALPKVEANIVWNAISGGKRPRVRVYDDTASKSATAALSVKNGRLQESSPEREYMSWQTFVLKFEN